MKTVVQAGQTLLDINDNIYESLGNNENEQPDSAEEGTNAPWRIIGPVL